MKLLFFCYFLIFLVQTVQAEAPHSFGYRGKKAVFIDISDVYIKYSFDVLKKQVFARSTVKFKSLESGYPILDLVPDASLVRLDGNEIEPLSSIADPDSVTTMRVVEAEVEANSPHELYVEYVMTANTSFESDHVRSVFSMSDLTDRKYFENYGPANLEFDQVHYVFDVEVVGTTVEHLIMHNGKLTQKSANSWTLDFPAHYTCSSIYFHLFEKGAFEVVKDQVSVGKKNVDLTFYSRTKAAAAEGLRNAKLHLNEFDTLFGEYCYDNFVGYITGARTGGMEYAGATRSSPEALRHEINHSWFARCVKPSGGNSGWMDEAIAMWSDYDFVTANDVPNRPEVNLANFSQYQRLTPIESYEEGRFFISELDFLLRSAGGMKKMLADYFKVKKFQNTTTPFFQNFLEQASGKSLNVYFKKYVYGKSRDELKSANKIIRNRQTGVIYHRELSAEEMKSLR